MNKWTKKETVVPTETKTEAISEAEETTSEAAEVTEVSEGNVAVAAARSARYSSRGVRRGRYRFAAWVGLVVILLAVVGLLSLLTLGVRLIIQATDHTELQNELTDFAEPIIEFKFDGFESIDQADEEDLLLAAIYRITQAERIRQLQQKTDVSLYVIDEYGRLIIPLREVNESFAILYGTDVTPAHRTIGEESGLAYTYEYDKANACYHVPTSISSSLYTTVTDEFKVSGKTARLRVGYALTAQLDIDNHGELIPPTADQIETYRYLTFTRVESDGEPHWILTAVTEETPPTAAATTTTTANAPSAVVTMPSATRTTTTTATTTAATTTTTAAENGEDEAE